MTTAKKPLAICTYCGQPFELSRNDKKFCNEFCRTAYHNDHRGSKLAEPATNYSSGPDQELIDQDMAAIKKVYNILVNNRIKLYNMYYQYERRVPMDDFLRYGLNLNYYTSQYKDDYYEKVFKMCFDYGYHIDENFVYLTYYANEIYFN